MDWRAHVGADAEKRVMRELVERATTAVEKHATSGYSTWGQSAPVVEVLDAETRGAELALSLLAHHYNYSCAQSGSDWADHYVLTGDATIVDGRVTSSTFDLVKHVHLTEHESDDYSPNATFEEARRMYRKPRIIATTLDDARPAEEAMRKQVMSELAVRAAHDRAQPIAIELIASERRDDILFAYGVAHHWYEAPPTPPSIPRWCGHYVLVCETRVGSFTQTFEVVSEYIPADAIGIYDRAQVLERVLARLRGKAPDLIAGIARGMVGERLRSGPPRGTLRCPRCMSTEVRQSWEHLRCSRCGHGEADGTGYPGGGEGLKRWTQ